MTIMMIMVITRGQSNLAKAASNPSSHVPTIYYRQNSPPLVVGGIETPIYNFGLQP